VGFLPGILLSFRRFLVFKIHFINRKSLLNRIAKSFSRFVCLSMLWYLGIWICGWIAEWVVHLPDTNTLYTSFRVLFRKFDERKDDYVRIVPDPQAKG